MAVQLVNNSEGEQAGYKWQSDTSYELLSQYDALHALGMAPGSSTLIVGGWHESSSSYPYAFRLTSTTTFTPLSGLGGYQTLATDAGIDSIGTMIISGYSVDSVSGYFRAVRWQGTSTTPDNLGTLAPNTPGRNGYALAVNSHGTIVGYSGIDGSGATHAFRIPLAHNLLSPPSHDLGTMNSGSGNSRANGINDLEEVVGSSSITISGVSQTRAFYRAPGAVSANVGFIDLGVLSTGNDSSAASINNNGHIVGSSRTTTSSGSVRAVLWFRNGTKKNLSLSESGVPGNVSNLTGWTLTSATQINEKGYIIGQGSYNGATRGFLLTPSTTY